VRIPKSQSITVEPEWYSGYALVEGKSGVHLLFNDDPENDLLENEKARTLTHLRKVTLRHVQLSLEGHVTRNAVDRMDADGANFRPELVLVPTPGKVIVFGQYKRSFHLGLLEF
jgi:hypothetical protein